MRVLHVIPSISADQGGLRSGTLLTCRAQAQAGMRPEIACLNGEADDLPVHRFKAGLRVTGASAEMRSWLIHNVCDFDAVFAHSIWLNPAHYAARAAALLDRPFFLLSRGMFDPDALAHHRLRKLVRWYTGVRKLVKGSILVFSSEADRDRATTHPDLAREKSIVVPNAVAMPVYAPPAGGPILCLNRLHPRKGVLEWVQGLGLLHRQGVRFTALHAGLAEVPDYAAAVRREAEPLVRSGLLELRDAVDNEAALALVARSSVVVHPATGFENFGNVIVEGMAAGKPVVASRRALVTPELEQAGVVVGVEPDPQALASAMKAALADGSIGVRARIYAQQHFSLEAVGQRWRQVLEGNCA